MTHFQALQAIFASIRADEATVRAVVDRMDLDPGVFRSLARLRAAGWDVVVTSAGCDWYIKILLDEAGVDLPVLSNPARFEEGLGLLMEMPPRGPYYSHDLGVDKAAVVRQGLAAGKRVAFAGDGFPDIDAARLVAGDLRFAHDDLARALEAEGLPFRTYGVWSEIADFLCALPEDGLPRKSAEAVRPEHRS
jgi:2-hydroxy-3-keto-5-methylthiopentenyl-1-phosphate phosphatase